MITRLKTHIPIILRFAVGLTLLFTPLFALAILGVVLVQRGDAHAQLTLGSGDSNCLTCHDEIPEGEMSFNPILFMSDPHGFGPVLPIYWYTQRNALAESANQPLQQEAQTSNHEVITTLDGRHENSAAAVSREPQAIDTE